MVKVNIGGDPLDPTHRYKRDRLHIERVARNGGMQRLTNIDEICAQLRVDGAFKAEFYGRIKKTGSPLVGIDIFKGLQPLVVLERMLNEMIAAHVLCAGCKYPELSGGVCRACGHVQQQTPPRRRRRSVEWVEQDEPHLPRLAAATALYKSMYDLPKSAAIDRAMEAFWEIDETNEARHGRWIAMATAVIARPACDKC